MSLGWSEESFIYSNITEKLKTLLDRRKTLYLQGSSVLKSSTSRTNDQIQYLTGNTSWVKLSSGVDELVEDDKGNIISSPDLSEQHVLFGGVFNAKDKSIKKGIFSKKQKESSYTYSSQFGFRPMAGITNTSIKTQGTFGAIKKATVEFQVNSLEELEKFEKIFMLPGYSILLEWGHSLVLKGKNKIEHKVKTYNRWFKDLHQHDEVNEEHRSAKILEDLDKLRSEQDFHYDALYGKVSNYVWSFNPDGTYNCSVDIVGYGELAESMSAIFTPSPTEEEEETISKDSVNMFYMYIKEILNIFPTPSFNRVVSNLRIESENLANQASFSMESTNGPDTTSSDAISKYFKNIVLLAIENSKAEDGKGITSKFITLGSLLNFININFALRDDGKKITSFYAGDYDQKYLDQSNLKAIASPDKEPRTPFITFDNHISTNLDVCFLPKEKSSTRKYNIIFASSKAVNETIIGKTNDILNILVNVQHIKDSYNEMLKNNKNEDINVYDFIKGILNDITKSLGNINSFAIETRDNLNFISDRGGTPGEKDITYTLDLFGLGSLATNVSLQSSIPSSLSSLIAIGASAGGSTLNEGIFNFQSFYKNFTDRIVPQRELDESVKNSKQFTNQLNATDRDRLKKHANILAAYVRAINQKRTLIDQSLSNLIPAHQTVTNLLLKRTLIKNDHNAPGVIPIQLSFEIFGVSGLRITDVFNIQQGLLPSRYKNNISFTITGIDNQIKTNRWTTTVSAVMIVTTPLKKILVGDFDIDDIFENIEIPFPSEILVEGYPNATKVRDYMKAQPGNMFTEKGAELTSSGMDITPKTAALAIALMKTIKKELYSFDYTPPGYGEDRKEGRPDNSRDAVLFRRRIAKDANIIKNSLKFRWTGGNDSFHLYNPDPGSSKHRFGNALDLAIQQQFSPEQENIAKYIVGKSSELVMATNKHKFVDEYTKPSAHANGQHFHFSIGGKSIQTLQSEEAERIFIEERQERERKIKEKFDRDTSTTGLRSAGL